MDSQKKLKTDRGRADVVNNHDPSIFKLNDDCARYIFSFLQLKQRIQIQRVCKRWQRISRLPWSDMKKLDLTAPRYLNPDPIKFKYDLPILKQVLNLCGSSITHMMLPDFHMTASSDLLILIKKMCPSLRSLDFQGVVITRKTAQFVAENFSELHEIEISQCWPKCEDFLAQFFANNKRLESIYIHGSDRITGACFSGLPESLTKITITTGNYIQPELFCNALQKLVNLRSFEVRNSAKLLHKFDSFIDALPNKLNIEELDLHSFSSDRAEKLIHIRNIVQLTNLQKLTLEGNVLLHDEILVNVSTYCKNLKIVHLHDSNRVTNSGWQGFTATLDLEELKVVDLRRLSDKFFAVMNIPSLKILKCYGCWRFSPKTFKKLIPRLENLERLEVYSCGDYIEYSADSFIKNILSVLRKRENGKILEMRILDRRATREVRKMSPLILINDKKYHPWE